MDLGVSQTVVYMGIMERKWKLLGIIGIIRIIR